MNRLLILGVFFLVALGLSAQPPGGGQAPGGRPGPGKHGGRPPMGMMNQELSIISMPEIPDLELQQREKLSKEIISEKKDVDKYIKEIRYIRHQMKEEAEMTPEETVKYEKKITQIEEKIQKRREKGDKKIRSILTEEQYIVFQEKKAEIKFNQPGGMDGRMPARGERERPDFPLRNSSQEGVEFEDFSL